MKKTLLTERFQELAGIKPLYGNKLESVNNLNEGIKLSDYMEGDKFKFPLPYFVPSAQYSNKASLDDYKMQPAKDPIKKEEGRDDQLVLVGGGKTRTYSIVDGEVADLITYEDALKKLN